MINVGVWGVVWVGVEALSSLGEVATHPGGGGLSGQLRNPTPTLPLQAVSPNLKYLYHNQKAPRARALVLNERRHVR